MPIASSRFAEHRRDHDPGLLLALLWMHHVAGFVPIPRSQTRARASEGVEVQSVV